MIWENESGKQMILDKTDNNGFKDFMLNNSSFNEIKAEVGNVRYYDTDEINDLTKNTQMMRILHFNCRMLSKNRGKINGFLNLFQIEPDIIMLSEVGKEGNRYLKSTFPNYLYESDLPKKNSYGGVAILVLNQFYDITINQDFKIKKKHVNA